MKTYLIINKVGLLRAVIFVLFLLFIIVGCSRETNNPVSSSMNEIPKITSLSKTSQNLLNTTTFNLVNRNKIAFGTLAVQNDNTNIYVTYTFPSGTIASNLQLWIGLNYNNVPKNKQNIPEPGHFPYKATPTELSYTFTIPLANLGINILTDYANIPLYIFAHADIMNGDEEGLWSANDNYIPTFKSLFGIPRWGFVSTYYLQVNFNNTQETSETAFAYGTHIFGGKSNPDNLPSLDIGNNWGWAINLPLFTQSFAKVGITTNTWQIYAAAGGNDITKGWNVGELSVAINGSNVTLTITLKPEYKMSELHIYINDKKPTTTAPGQYGFTATFDPKTGSYTKTFNLSDTDNDGIWIIVHMVTWGVFQK